MDVDLANQNLTFISHNHPRQSIQQNSLPLPMVLVIAYSYDQNHIGGDISILQLRGMEHSSCTNTSIFIREAQSPHRQETRDAQSQPATKGFLHICSPLLWSLEKCAHINRSIKGPRPSNHGRIFFQLSTQESLHKTLNRIAEQD
jgi:hypothetical protein